MKLIRDHWSLIAIASLTLLGLILRLYHLDWQCLTIDEKVTYQVASRTTMDLIKWALGGDYNPPTYYILAHWSSILFGGVSNFAIRFPAMILGTLTIPIAYLVGKEYHDNITGILVATIICFSYPTILYAQNARPYSLVFLTFLCFTFFFIRMYKGDIRNRNVLFLCVFAAACLWSHFYSLMPLVISGVILGLKYRQLIWKGIFLVVLFCLPFIPYFDVVKNQFRVFAIAKAAHYPPGASWVDPHIIAVMTPNELFCWAWIIFIPIITYSLWKYRDPLNRDLTIIATITCLSMIPMAYITAMLPRYALLVLPMYLCIAAYPVSKWIEPMKPTQKGIIVLLILFVIFLMNYGSLLQLYTLNLCEFYHMLL